MASRRVPSAEWSTFLPSFGRRHDGWLIRLGAATEYVVLRGIRLDGDRLVLGVGDRGVTTEIGIEGVRQVTLELTTDGIEGGLWIQGRDGDLTVRFRSAIAPELVDGRPL